MTDFQRRILAYLDASPNGRRWRVKIMEDLAPPDSIAAKRGSSQNAARLVGAWCNPLIENGLVRLVHHRDSGYYMAHEITDKGRVTLREATRCQDI